MAGNKSNRIARVTKAKLLRQIPSVLDELGNTDRERIERVLSLLGPDGKSQLSECLKNAFPGKAVTDAMKAFKVLRLAVNKAADTADVPLRFTVDTSKKTPPAGRFCWFEAEDTTEQEIIQFSDQGTSDVDPSVSVASTGLLTDWRKLAVGETPVRIFVSYETDDGSHASELLDCIKAAWAARLPLNAKLPEPDWIWIAKDQLHGGNDWEPKIIAAMEQAHICLAMVSNPFLASQFIQETEIPHFLSRKKPIVPIRLAPHAATGERIERLHPRQIVVWPGNGKNSPLSYAEIRASKSKRPQFAELVLQGIVDAIAEWRGLDTARSTPPMSATTFQAEDVLDRRLDDLVEEAADLAHAVEDDVFIPGHGRRISLGELERFDLSKSLPEGKVGPAIEQLQAWLDDPHGSPFFAMLGELGIGKTTTLKCFTRRLLEGRKRKSNLPLPIFVDLRLYHNDDTRRKVPTLEELLAEVVRHHWKGGGAAPLTAQEIIDAVQKDGALIIFDGLDEKLVHYNREQSGQFIRELWRILPPSPKDDLRAAERAAIAAMRKKATDRPSGERRGRMIMSCRSHYFKDVISQNAMLLGEYRDGVEARDYEVCVILPFNDEQVRDYLRIVLGSESRADDAVAFFKKVHNLEELSRRPFLLSQIVPQLAQLEARQMRGERILGITIYEDLIARWLARDSGKNQFTDAHKLDMMEQLAADMAVEGSRSWPWDKVERWLGRFLAARDSVAVFYRQHSPDVLHQDFRTATFVLRPDDSRSEFRFAHSSLGEFFHARQLVHALDDGVVDDWQIPLPSVETLEFVGQFLALEPRPERIAAIEQLLAGGGLGAVVALRLWLIAVQHGYPQPGLVTADLRGVELDGWEIAGAAHDRPLCLRGVKFNGASLRGGRLRFVDLSGASFTDAHLNVARFEHCRLDGAQLGNCDLSGTVLRHCSGVRLAGAEAKLKSTQWIEGNLTGAHLPTDLVEKALVARCRRGPETFSLPANVPADLQVAILDAHHGSVTCVAWSPDGHQLLSGSDDNTLRVWDPASGQSQFTLQGHSRGVRACACSPDGQWFLSASDDNTLRVWDAASGRSQLTLQGHTGRVMACAWSPDGQQLLSGSDDNMLRLWDAASGQSQLTLQGHSGWVMACAWSPDGQQLLSGSDDNTLRVWDAASGRSRLTLEGHTGAVRACAWSPDSQQFLSGSGDNTLRVWDAASGQSRLTLHGHTGGVRACAWSPDGQQLLSASSDNTLRVWDAASGQSRLTLHLHLGDVRACAWSSDGQQLVSASDDSTLRVWDADCGQSRLTLHGHTNWVRACAWSPDGQQLVSASDDSTLRVWDADCGQSRLTLHGHTNWVRACAWSPDGRRLVSGSDDYTLRVWDATSGLSQHTLQGHTHRVSACAWSPDGREILSGSEDNTLRVWDATSGQSRLTLEGYVLSCAWSPDGQQLLSASQDNKLRVWDAASGRSRLTLQGHTGWVWACAWSPDGRLLLSASSDKTLRVWDAASGQSRLTLQGHTGWIRACAWSPDGRQFLSASEDNTLRVWEAANGASRLTLRGHTRGIRACAWSPDGQQILSGSEDNTLRVWDAASGRCLLTIAYLPGGEFAALDDHGIRSASPGAWPYLAWRLPTPHGPRLLPAEFFGELPSS